MPHFYGKISDCVVTYRGKDKNTTQGNLAELVGSPVAPIGVSIPPSLGSSILCSLASAARSAETSTKFRDRNKITTGFEITAGAVEN